MKPLRTRLLEARERLGVPWEVLERDYLLSWVLAGLASVDELRASLVFKGGTCLRKCYFGDYRFSEDLDFSTFGAAPAGDALEATLQRACATVVQLLDEITPIEVSCERYVERDPHPGGQEAFTIRARLPWQRTAHTRVLVEITRDEAILRPIESRAVLHAYDEPFDVHVQTYALDEVIAEKLRALLQHAAKLRQRGWSRSRARDYYDLWRILNAYKLQDAATFPALLHDKCQVRAVTFAGPDDFLAPDLLHHVDSTWDQWLGPLVPSLPPFQQVITDLRPRLAALLSPSP